MGKRRAFGRRGLSLIIAAVMTVLMVLASIAGNVYAAAGDVPAHKKSIKPNGDGTYKLALNVTGQAEKVPQYVNVTVIMDVSGSMNTNTTNNYTQTSATSGPLFGRSNGNYFRIYNSYGNWYDEDGNRYYGNRYTADDPRIEAAQNAVNSLASALLSKNGQNGNPTDIVEMSLVTFSNGASLGILATEISGSTVYSENVEVPM